MPEIAVPARCFRAGVVTRAQLDTDPESRRVELSFSSEAPVEREFGWEVLGHGEGEVDLARLSTGAAPLLIDHRAGLGSQVGVVESVTVAEGRGRAVVRFGVSRAAGEMLARVRDGEVSAVSVGYRVHKMTAAGERGGVPVYRATRWEPLEISLVALPADTSVGVGRAAGEPETVILRVEREMPDPIQTPAPAPAPAPAPSPAPTGRAESPAPSPAEPARPDPVAAERARIAEIHATAARFEVPEDATQRAIAEGHTVAAFQRAVLDHLAGRSAEAARAGAARIGMTQGEVRRFSFLRALRALANPNDSKARAAAGFEFEVSEAAAKAAGREARGIMIPPDVLGQSVRASDLVAGTPASGGNLVDEVLLAGSFIDILRNSAILPRLGVRVMGDLRGDVAIPKQTGAGAAYWIAEDGSPTNSGADFGQVKMTPRTLGAITEISRRLLIQSSLDVEALVRADLAQVMALAIDHAGLNGNADVDAPDGLADDASVPVVDFATAGAPTYAETVKMWTRVAEGNAAVGNLAYALHPAQVEHLMTTPKFASGDTPIMATMDRLNGYRAEWSNQVTAGTMWFGNWSDFVLGMWSGLDLTVDPYTKADSGAIRVVALQDVDFALRNPTSFCKGVLVP